MPTPLFSTYRQGENRVSSSILAVFERLGIDLVARVLGGALERPELELVTYRSQPGGGGKGTPDGEMRGSFRFLFEVKTSPGQVRGKLAKNQLQRHLDRLVGDHRTELVVVLTPDVDPPLLVDGLEDDRLVWTSFEALAQSLNQLVGDPNEPASEQQRLLLRELVALFELDGLTGGEDVAVVAAGEAYAAWRSYGAYVCQANRAFRRVKYWGFYRAKAIQPEFPLVRHRWTEVDFTVGTATKYKKSQDPMEKDLGVLIERMLQDGVQEEGVQRAAFLLQPSDDPQLVRRDQPLPHLPKGAWTQQQRYARLADLLEAETTSDLA